MSFFTSHRERWLWFWALAVVAAIYSTLASAPAIAAQLSDLDLLDEVFWLGLYLIPAAILALGLRARPRGAEIGIAFGVVAVYILVFNRVAFFAEERSHMVEYSMVALFVYHALIERQQNSNLRPNPAWIAFAIASLVGILDEVIQLFLPNRVFDIVDIGFNSFAALIAIIASLALDRVQRWRNREI
jgi:hypothetical protein